jgi:hypothetical protein
MATSSGSGGGGWEALPQRSRRSRGGASDASKGAVQSLQATEEQGSVAAGKFNDHHNNVYAGASDSHIAGNREKVEQNIENRKRIKRAEATLQGKDGCAREFYECSLITFLVGKDIDKIRFG